MSISSFVHRAIVSYVDAVTGEIRVIAPTLAGGKKEITVSLYGRKPSAVSPGVYTYSVPDLGQQVIIVADDHNLTNVFILEIWR